MAKTKNTKLLHELPRDPAADDLLFERVMQLEELVADLADALLHAQPRDQVMMDKARKVQEKFKG